MNVRRNERTHNFVRNVNNSGHTGSYLPEYSNLSIRPCIKESNFLSLHILNLNEY